MRTVVFARPSFVYFLICFFISSTFGIHSAEAASEWLRAPLADRDVAGVTLLIHGLNTKPDKMRSIASELNGMKQDVLLVKLTGHDKDLAAFRQVTREKFLNDVEEAAKRASEESRGKVKSLNLVAFSLGGLVAIDLVSEGRAAFDRMVLLAPALAIRGRSYLIKIFVPFGRGFLVPSLSPEDYRANSGTSIAAYLALFESLAAIQATPLLKGNVPTLVFVDPDDELVSVGKLSELIRDKVLTEWHLETITASGSTVRPMYHHLIIDEPTLGSVPWRAMIEKIRRHLAH